MANGGLGDIGRRRREDENEAIKVVLGERLNEVWLGKIIGKKIQKKMNEKGVKVLEKGIGSLSL